MVKISVVINTLNEEKNIARAIGSVKKIADEIVVVDMESMDHTKEIARKLGAKVYDHKKTGYVEPARNFAIAKAKNEWILILDADEEIGVSLAKMLKDVSQKARAHYYRLPRKNIVFGKWLTHSRWWPDYNIRFFKKDYVSWNEVIHSVPMTTGKGADLEAKEEYAIVHHHYENIEQYIDRLNRYSYHQAATLIKSGYKLSKFDVLQKPTNEFLSRYFFGQGYKDGFHGLVVSLLQAFSELVVYLKVWQNDSFKGQTISVDEAISKLTEVQKDLNYWKADTLYKEKGGLVNQVKRKFKLL